MIRVFLFIDLFILLVATTDSVRQHRRSEDETNNNHRFFVNVLIVLAAPAESTLLEIRNSTVVLCFRLGIVTRTPLHRRK